jgi:hypothetical protein
MKSLPLGNKNCGKMCGKFASSSLQLTTYSITNAFTIKNTTGSNMSNDSFVPHNFASLLQIVLNFNNGKITILFEKMHQRIYYLKRLPAPPGGLEPPTFRLTAERASQLRHGGCIQELETR